MLKEEKYTIEGAKEHLKIILNKDNSQNKQTTNQFIIKKETNKERKTK